MTFDINIRIDESLEVITISGAEYYKGDKGDDFTYEDFTPAQLEALKVKGDPFLYSDFTPAQIAELQRPATEAVTAVNEAEALRVTAETTRVENEQGRVTAEGTRLSNEIARENSEEDRYEAEALRLSAEITRGQNEQARITGEGLRVDAESTRQTNTATAITNANNAATNANTKAGLADTAANNANEKATLANNAAILANEKAGLANTAATNADNARLAIAGELALKADQIELNQLADEVSLLDAVQGAKIKDIESIISTMNPNQSAQLSVSGISPLSLPKNAANGGMSVKLEGLTEDVGGVITHFEPTGRVRSVGKNILDISSLKSSDFINIGTGYMATLIPVIPNVTYTVKIYDTANLGNPSFYVQLRNEDLTGPQSFLSPSGFGTFSRVFPTDKMVFSISAVTSNLDSRLEYIKKNIAIQIERSSKWTPYEPYKETNLYIDNNTKLRSLPNGVKDEIRSDGKGGYELVKRIVPSETISMSAVRISITSTNPLFQLIALDIPKVIPNVTNNSVGFGGNISIKGYREIASTEMSTLTEPNFFYLRNEGSITAFYIYVATGSFVTLAEAFELVRYLDITYETVAPIITPLVTSGSLISHPNGTVYHEPVIADAGVYGTKMDILLTDYPIATIEEIIKHENGVDTYLNVATAVVASDGLSFTHPNLVSGDLVLFTYAFEKESTNGNITATFYDSNVVKIDTVTGKAYRINEVVTNGVLTRTLTEV